MKNWIKKHKNIIIKLLLPTVLIVGMYGFYQAKAFESKRNSEFLTDVIYSLIQINNIRDESRFSNSDNVLSEAYYDSNNMKKTIERMEKWEDSKNTTIKKTTEVTLSALNAWKEANEVIIKRDSDFLAKFSAKIKEANNESLFIGMESIGTSTKKPLYLTNTDKARLSGYVERNFGEALKKQGAEDDMFSEVFSAGAIKAWLDGKFDG